MSVGVEKVAYRISEAVDASGLGRTLLYEQISAGNLEVIHVGRRTLIPAEALHDFISRLRAEQNPNATTGSPDRSPTVSTTTDITRDEPRSS